MAQRLSDMTALKPFQEKMTTETLCSISHPFVLLTLLF